jgi:tetratricopeptide (TPR) repeat protein
MRVHVVVVFACMLARAASAQPIDPASKAQADAAHAEATVAYNANDFMRAALKFEEAYRLVNDPAYLFNIGQSYRHGQECVKAADAFAKYVELVPDAPNIAKAKDLLKETTSCALFVEGRRLMGAGRPAEACEKFNAAHEDDPDAIGTLLNLGLCNEQIGKLATAALWLRKAQKKAIESKVPEADEQARQRLDGITKKIPKVKIVLVPGVPDAIVKVDGKQITVLEDVEVDAGRHTIDVEAPGMKPAQKTFEIAIGGRATANVPLVSATAPAARSKRSAYAFGATGLALWTGTAVLAVVAKDRYDSAATFDEQRTWKNVARYGVTSMFVLGTAAITTSVVLFVRNRRGRTEHAVLVPAVGENEVGLSFGGRF